jgi:hypothetical protein
MASSLSVALADHRNMALLSSASLSICYDFILRIAERANIRSGTLEKFPTPAGRIAPALSNRGLRLLRGEGAHA